jgi:hypothetical protein
LVLAAQTKKTVFKKGVTKCNFKKNMPYRKRRKNGRYGNGTTCSNSSESFPENKRRFQKKPIGKRSAEHGVVIVKLININITVVLNYWSLSLGESYNTNRKNIPIARHIMSLIDII